MDIVGIMKEKDGVNIIEASSADEWRRWLSANHNKEKSIWLIIFHKDSTTKSVYYDEAVDEALCFGWIDSKPNKRDKESYFQFFSKRNPKSNWSRKNRVKIERLIKAEWMKKAGLEMVEHAKATGTWKALEDVENLIIPKDLQIAFDNNEKAYKNYQAFPASSKRIILEWIFNAKREATRKKRIKETVLEAEQNIKANHFSR